MEKAVGALPKVVTGASGDADLLAGRVGRARCRCGQIEAGPIAVVERPRPQGRAEVVGEDASRDVDNRGPLYKRDVVRTVRFLERKRHVHVAEVEDEGHASVLEA